jgi:hypothetical protein
METLLVYTKGPEKTQALKAFLKALKINFEKSLYNSEVVSKIKRSDEEIKADEIVNGKVKPKGLILL